MRCEYALRIGENPKRAPFTLRLFNKIMGLHPAHWDIKLWAGLKYLAGAGREIHQRGSTGPKPKSC